MPASVKPFLKLPLRLRQLHGAGHDGRTEGPGPRADHGEVRARLRRDEIQDGAPLSARIAAHPEQVTRAVKDREDGLKQGAVRVLALRLRLEDDTRSRECVELRERVLSVVRERHDFLELELGGFALQGKEVGASRTTRASGEFVSGT